MSFWSSISFNLAVLMNLLVAFFYPLEGVRGGQCFNVAVQFFFLFRMIDICRFSSVVVTVLARLKLKTFKDLKMFCMQFSVFFSKHSAHTSYNFTAAPAMAGSSPISLCSAEKHQDFFFFQSLVMLL